MPECTSRHPPFRRHRSPRFLRRLVRHGVRQLGIHPYRVVFHERYDTTFPGLPVDPLRADRILAFLASEGFVLRCSVFRPEAVWMKALAKVHHPDKNKGSKESEAKFLEINKLK